MRLLNDEEIKEVTNIWANTTSYGGTYLYEKAIAKAQHQLDMKDFIEWGREKCPHIDANFERRSCLECWQSLKDSCNL